MSLEPGSTFGPYRIVGPLGRGGMAVVVRAHDPALDREVALKVLPPELLHDPTFAERFRQEARVAARLEHPHILPVHAYGIEDGRPWMALRLVTGGSLGDRLRRGPLSAQAAATTLAEVASALDYAHAHGVVHRDVKPANVLLDDAGHAYLADFGIARLAEGSAIVTATGIVQGTPAYMAPEQALGSKVDARADVYALGVMAFECLTGRVPYTGATPVAVLMKHVTEPVPEPSPAEVAAPLTPVLRRCLAKDPAQRWPSAGSFAQALTAASLALPGGGATPPALPTLVVPDDVPAEPRSFTAAPAAAPSTPAVATRLEGGAKGGSWARGLALGAGALVILAVGLAGVWAGLRLLGWDGSVPPSSPSSGTTVSAPPPSMAPTPAAPMASPTPASPTPAPSSPAAQPPPATPAVSPRPAAVAERPVVPPRAATPQRAPDAPGQAAPATGATTSPYDLASRYRGEGEPARRGKLRVYCEPSLDVVLFPNTDVKDVADSAKDLREALEKRAQVEVVPSRAQADAVVQVLERGRQPARFGMRKVRVRVAIGAESLEILGQDSAASFNTWSGAAGGAARQIEAWLARRSPAARP